MPFSKNNRSVSLSVPVLASLSGLALITATNAMAQDATALPEIVVTASRTPLDLDKVGSTVNVVSSKELEKHGQTFVSDYLSRMPGIHFAQSGPAGTLTTIRMRGAQSRYIKVLIDGIDVSDPSSTQTTVQFENLLVGDVERIEVLKGSQSTLYGGDAVAGVISITTKKAASNGFSLRANGEYGQFNSRKGGATLGYAGEQGDISVSVHGVKTRGFSSAEENTGNTEKDGYENLTFSGRGSYNLNDSLRLFFSARSFRSNVEFDDFSFFTGLPIDDTIGNNSTTKQKAGLVGAELSLFNGLFTNKLTLQGMDIERDTFSSFPSLFEGERVEVNYQGLVKFHDRFSLMIGAEQEKTASRANNAPVKQEAQMDSLFTQALVEPIDNLNLTAGLRRDHHDEFGEFDTWRVTGAWFIPQSETKFHASYGTGFRAPSLFELFDPFFGNRNLQPEESISWDVGVDQQLLDGKLNVSATYFSLNTESLIGFVFPAGYTTIDGTTQRTGVEFSATAELTQGFSANAAYTYTDAREEDGTRLVRAPRHVLALGAEFRPTDKLSLSATARFVRDSVDLGGFQLDDYVVVNSKLTYAISEQMSAYVRGENLFNEQYQTINGFGTSDRAFYAGLKVKFPAQ